MIDDLKNKIKADMIESMRSGDKERLSTIRMLQAAIKQKEVDQRVVLTDSDLYPIIEKMIKQRSESVKQFEEGNRPELAAKESREILLLRNYLPMPYSPDVLTGLIQDAISQVGASTTADLGKVIAIIKPKIQGRADMADVTQRIKAFLTT